MGGGIPDPGIRFQIFEPGRLNGSKYQIYDNIQWSHDITCSVDATEKTIRNSEEFEDFRSDHFEFRNGIMIILTLHHHTLPPSLPPYLPPTHFLVFSFESLTKYCKIFINNFLTKWNKLIELKL